MVAVVVVDGYAVVTRTPTGDTIRYGARAVVVTEHGHRVPDRRSRPSTPDRSGSRTPGVSSAYADELLDRESGEVRLAGPVLGTPIGLLISPLQG